MDKQSNDRVAAAIDELAARAGAFVLDIGGEGRHPAAWNLNPRASKTFGPEAGQPIPRLIRGRGDAIPLADSSVDLLIVERTPLRAATLREMLRVARPGALCVLRHVVTPAGDPHRLALRLLPGTSERRATRIGSHAARETVIRFEENRPLLGSATSRGVGGQ
jgi:hypothetical protein